MRTAIEAIEVVSDLGRAETIFRLRLFEPQRDASGLHEIELPPRYVTAGGADLNYSHGTFTAPNRRRYRPAVSNPG